MGVSYFTPTEQTYLNDEFFNLHATFARPIVIYQTATQTVVFTSPNENILFENAPFNSQTETVINSGIFQARILYAKKELLIPFGAVQRDSSSDQNMIRLQEGEVRVRLDATGAAFLNSSERVTFDGNIFDLITTPRPHGLFTPNFYDFYLKKIQ